MTSNKEQPEPSVQHVTEESSFAAFAKKQLTRQMRLERLYGPAVSVALHILVILLLLLVIVDTGENKKQEEIMVTMVEPVDMQPIEEFTPPEPQPIADEVDIPDVASPMDAIAMPAAPVEESVGEAAGTLDDVMDLAVSFNADTASPLVLQGLFAGRSKAGKAAGLALYADGKGNLTEASVLKALEWLKNHQQPDGSWHTARDRYNVAFTGLATLTFLAHGETLTSDRYGETLQKGLRWLIDIQKPNGAFTSDAYAHAIATYAVSEGYALTQIPFLKESMEKSVAVIVKGQQDNGGWTYGYAHNGRRDTSVMGWQIQALKAAFVAGCATSGLRECMRKAALAIKLQYYDHKNPASGGLRMGTLSSATLGGAQEAIGSFIYAANGTARATGGGNASMTAVGTLSLEFLGAGTSAEARGGRGYLRKTGCDWLKPGGWPLYRWYYTTQAIFQGLGIPGNTQGKEDWKSWNNMFAKAFVNNQNPDGSWRSPAKGEDGKWILDQTGSVYSTALGALTLMVYYRILPSYQH